MSLHQVKGNQCKPGSQSMPLIYPNQPPPVSNYALFTVCHCMTQPGMFDELSFSGLMTDVNEGEIMLEK